MLTATCTREGDRGDVVRDRLSFQWNEDVKINSINTATARESHLPSRLTTLLLFSPLGGAFMHSDNNRDRSQVGPKSFVEIAKKGFTGIPSLDRNLLDFAKYYDDDGEMHLAPVEVGSWKLLTRGEVAELIFELQYYLDFFTDEQIAFDNQHLGRSQPQASPNEHSYHGKKKVPGYIYLLHAAGTNRYKIGLTTDINRRIGQIGKQSPFPIKLVHSFRTDNCVKSEEELHRKYDSFRIHGEWFELTEEHVEEFKAIVGNGGVA